MLLEILKDSLRYNFKNVGSISTMGILFLFSFLVLPIILIFGYSYRITEIGLNGLINTEMLISTDKDLKFNDFKKMFKDGIKTIILVISYLLIPIILSIIFINNHGFFISNIGSDIMIDLSHEMFLTEFAQQPSQVESAVIGSWGVNDSLFHLGFATEVTSEEALEMFDTSLSVDRILLLYTAGLTTVFIATLVPVLKVVRTKPKKILLQERIQ